MQNKDRGNNGNNPLYSPLNEADGCFWEMSFFEALTLFVWKHVSKIRGSYYFFLNNIVTINLRGST